MTKETKKWRLGQRDSFKLDTLSIKYYGGYIVIIKTIILDTLTIKYYSGYIVIIKTVVLAAGILTGIIEQESTSRVVKQLYTLVFKRSLKYIMPKPLDTTK